MTLTKAQKAELDEERAYAIHVLTDMLSPGDEIGTVLIHGRGLTDYVECFVGRGRKVERITYYVARAIGAQLTEKGIPRGGGQYDKAHDVVEALSRKLYGTGHELFRNRMLG